VDGLDAPSETLSVVRWVDELDAKPKYAREKLLDKKQSVQNLSENNINHYLRRRSSRRLCR